MVTVAKIATILYLATVYDRTKARNGSIKRYIYGFAIVAAPMFLVLAQPDMGSALVFLPIFLVMSFIAGVKLRYLVYVLITGSLLIYLSVLPSWQYYIAVREIAFIEMLSSKTYGLYGLILLGILMLLSSLGYFILKRQYFYWLIYTFSSIFFAFAGSFVMRSVLKDYQMKRLKR
mgnify:FL=1